MTLHMRKIYLAGFLLRPHDNRFPSSLGCKPPEKGNEGVGFKKRPQTESGEIRRGEREYWVGETILVRTSRRATGRRKRFSGPPFLVDSFRGHPLSRFLASLKRLLGAPVRAIPPPGSFPVSKKGGYRIGGLPSRKYDPRRGATNPSLFRAEIGTRRTQQTPRRYSLNNAQGRALSETILQVANRETRAPRNVRKNLF